MAQTSSPGLKSTRGLADVASKAAPIKTEPIKTEPSSPPAAPPKPPEPVVEAPTPEAPIQAPPAAEKPVIHATQAIQAAPPTTPDPAIKLDPREAALAHLKANDPTASLMSHNERVENPALPRRADRINDWFPEYHYRWVLCPSRNPAQVEALAGLGVDHATQRGYRFYRAEDLRRGPNTEGLPWHPSWEDDNGKVLWAGMWLMYRSAEYERHARKDLERRARERREAARAPSDLNEHGQRSLGFESQRVPVNQLLRETPDPRRGQDGVMRPPRQGGAEDSFNFGKVDGYGGDDYGG